MRYESLTATTQVSYTRDYALPSKVVLSLTMRALTIKLAVAFALSGCEDSEAVSTAQLVDVSTLTNLSANAQPVVDRGGTLIWEVQNSVGRIYASQDDLPAAIPSETAMLFVIADAATCTPKCTPIGVARFRVPSEVSQTSATADGDFTVQLSFNR